MPLRTHPLHGYRVDDLPGADDIVSWYRLAGDYARNHDIRLSFHPDQFVVLNSQSPAVVDASLAEIEYQGEVAEWIGADVINVHAGGGFGDKKASLADFARNIDRLSPRARSRLTVENDDKIYTPYDLLPVCRSAWIPLVYDVHHHRCHPDILSEEEATDRAIRTWDREPLFHLSSPIHGWSGPYPERHHDYVDLADFPACWRNHDLTIEVEAKAKELAVIKLMRSLESAPVAADRTNGQLVIRSRG